MNEEMDFEKAVMYGIMTHCIDDNAKFQAQIKNLKLRNFGLLILAIPTLIVLGKRTKNYISSKFKKNEEEK